MTISSKFHQPLFKSNLGLILITNSVTKNVNSPLKVPKKLYNIEFVYSHLNTNKLSVTL